MSDTTPEFPQDLLDLERARVQARLDLDLYVATVEVERRAAYPGEDQIVERRTWPAEQTDRWNELRNAYQQAATAVREHPPRPGRRRQPALAPRRTAAHRGTAGPGGAAPRRGGPGDGEGAAGRCRTGSARRLTAARSATAVPATPARARDQRPISVRSGRWRIVMGVRTGPPGSGSGRVGRGARSG